MSSRTYLSIGDVLSLLREEFPDVTISKIRFLESQGLVNPERSPSGYRKFFEHDVERLRWVLRQQREHFLPLKVIRDRLDREADGAIPADDPAEQHVEEPVAVHASVGASDLARGNGTPARAEEPALALSGGGHLASAIGRDATPGARATTPSSDPLPARAAAPTPPAPAARPAPSAAVRPAAPSAAHSPGTPPPPPGTQPPGTQPPATHSAAAQPPAAQSTPPVPPTPRDPAAGSPAALASAGPPAVSPSTSPIGGGAEVLSASVSGASLTAEELCSATGLSITDIASLEGFGLIEPMAVAGVLYYDEEALTVAKLVADFARYGIEPRHLRLYRNAVDREMGLVEQIVTPLLRQRNPEARQRAVAAAADLTKLGQGLRASLLRREIRRQLGG